MRRPLSPRAAKRRVGGGICLQAKRDDEARKRYEVKVRRGAFKYEVDLSRTFRVLDVKRERIGDDGNDD